jgi:hypothetical protein
MVFMQHLIQLLFLFLGITIQMQAQINAYAKVTAITNGSVLTLSNVNQTFDTFVAGEYVVVIQMQGATITGNTADNANFGIPNSLNSAGLYEIAVVQAVNGGATSMTLSGSLANAYSTAGSVQILSYPRLGTTSFSTTANINGVAWNGNVGGVIAFYVTGNLFLFHNINADAIGFRGGAKSGQDGGGCVSNVFRIAAGDARYASKGEGVYIATAAQAAGKAKAVNGGGGGLVHNGGGGGGGNYTAGGDGYFGWNGSCSIANSAGGQGGLAVSSNNNRVFMGGGGGGGQENNGVGTNGGNGGGIILLRADTLVVAGACSSVSISANGATAASGGNDGMGGGGAGGSMVLEVLGIRAVGACPLSISANGGNGGSVGNATPHGAGGGGAQGAIYISATGTFTNTTINTSNGVGGNASNGGSPPTASPGGGTSGSGVITGTVSSPLPVELMHFYAEQKNKTELELIWQTASEKNNAGFEILHTLNGREWQKIGFVNGKGYSNVISSYTFTHHAKVGEMNYYKLKQLDTDGSFNYSSILYVSLDYMDTEVKLFPNPSRGIMHLETEMDVLAEELKVFNSAGWEQNFVLIKDDNHHFTLDLSVLPKGLYVLRSPYFSKKIVLE